MLTKITRFRAAAMQASRLSDVRFSSSMIPILSVFGARPSISSTRREHLDGERDLVGPVLLGLDDVDAAGARVADAAEPAQVVQAAVAATSASSRPSATSAPSAVSTASVAHVVADCADQQQRPAR